MEFGDYYDNLEALFFARRQIDMGHVREGLKVLRELRNHIQTTADTKSERYLLGNIDFYEMAATEYHGLPYRETIPPSPRAFARRLIAVIRGCMRSMLAFAARGDGMTKARSAKTIPPMCL